MVNSLNFNSSYVNGVNGLDNAILYKKQPVESEEQSIFNQEEGAEALEESLANVCDKHGFILGAWDNFKGAVGIGTSSNKCNDAIEKYKNGEISFDEAMAEIEKFNVKQDSSLDLFSNIATGVAAIVVSTLTGGAAAPIVAGALTGAVTKSGFKAADRATNDIEGDAIDAKQLAKDALSGAVTGAIGVKTAGTAGSPFANGYKIGGKTLTGTAACIAKCAETGFKTGAISGAANYSIDCAFEDDKTFNVDEFVATTATSSLVGGTVGALMGGFNGTLRTHGLLNAGGSVLEYNKPADILANSICSAEYKVVNNTVRSIAA